MTGQKPATAGAKFRIPLGRYNAADQLGGGPDAAGILPAPAASPQPFPQNRPGGNQPAFRFLKRAGERSRLTGGPHADGDERREQIGRDCQP